MSRKQSRMIALAVFSCMICLICRPVVFGNFLTRGHYRYARELPGGHVPLMVRGNRYFYHHGMFYHRGGRGFTLVAPPMGAIVPLLPLGFMTLVLAGMTYHCYDGVYYRECPSGYMVVPDSEIQEMKRKQEISKEVVESATEDISQNGREFVVYVPNKGGSYTPVKLIKLENGYKGPQGEFYPDHPTVKQLQVLYGK